MKKHKREKQDSEALKSLNDVVPDKIAKSTGRISPKILLFDIETRPHLVYVWNFKNVFISPSQVKEYGHPICYSAKWLGSDLMLNDGMQNDKDDKRMCKTLWNLFDEADMVVAHNGKAFDTKTMKARWVFYGMNPPSPYKQADTLLIARHQFKFPSNSLESLAKYLGLGGKIAHHGFALWTECIDGKKSGWKTMTGYNIHDVHLLEEVYLKLRAWDTRHPNMALMYDDDMARCTVCGSRTLKNVTRQSSHTGMSSFPTVQCRNCGHYMRTRVRDPRSPVLSNTL